ncbi:hypothetical protein PG996_006241 [Apiospora saccharicola]|uniref:Glucose receptor Git3 N-terminal domain-containing protein n=1 Tax=Apiospora saccharicola TaxID=335842 RepID=A0ABR1VNW8_9PEZI
MTLQDLISRGGGGGDESLVGPGGLHGDINGLPTYVRSGLIAIAFFALLSLVSATGLFLYISYRLLKWHFFFKLQQSRRRSPQRPPGPLHRPPNPGRHPGLHIGPAAAQPAAIRQPLRSLAASVPVPVSLAVTSTRSPPPSETGRQRRNTRSDTSGTPRARPPKLRPRPPPPLPPRSRLTPFLLLIYNLLLADIIQAVSFLLSVAWLHYDATYSGSVTCWIQGWLAMTGKLAASACLVFASGLTYMTVVRGYRASPRALYVSIAAVWLFTYVPAGAGVAITHNGRGGGGWFSWSNGWCWVNSNFRVQRFWLGYFWIFLSVGLTILIYAAIFVTMLRRKKLSWRHMPDLEEDMDRDLQSLPPRGKKAPPRPSGHHPVFLVYPFIYLLVTGPLATGRMLTMAGYNVSMTYYLLAGAISASHGFLNVALWSTCILFMGQKEKERLGLDRFMQTPRERTYGNMVWIQGGMDHQ